MERGRKELTPLEKNLIAQIFISNSTNGVIRRGKQAEVVASFGVSLRTVQYIWTAVKQQQLNGQPVMFSSKKLGITHIGRVNGNLDEKKNEVHTIYEERNHKKIS